MPVDPSFFAKMRAARVRAKITQAALGARVGVSSVQISRIELGERGAATETLVAIAMVLDLDLNLLKPAGPLEEAPTEPYTPVP